jgi:hypothetical protein
VTHSAFSESSSPASAPTAVQRAEPQAAQPPALSREAADFLIELSVTLQKRAMYPPGHPYLKTSTERLMRRAETLLGKIPMAVFGIARDQLVVDGAATDPKNTIFRELADRLHRHRLATLRLVRGITDGELDRLVTLLCGEPTRTGRATLLAETASLEHVHLQPIEYERIILEEGDGSEDGSPSQGGRRDDLWVDLARLAAESSPGSYVSESDEAEPVVLARSIDCGSAEAGYDREVLGRLTRLAEELAATGGSIDPVLQIRLSKLLASLRPGTLARLLAAGEDDADRRRFVMATSAALDVGAVMKVIEAVASAAHQEVSHHLLRLLRKMGTITPAAPQETRIAADSALRANLNRLLADWRLDDPNPEAYTAALDTMATTSPGEGARVEACDPIVILQAAIEAGASGPRTEKATRDALADGRLDELVAILQRAPAGARTDEVWRNVATPERLREALNQGRLFDETVGVLITRLGEAAIDPLLDLLAKADDRASRAATLRTLAGLGAPARDRAMALLPDSPWYVQRNLFVLLGRLGGWPRGLSTAPYLSHADARVRREAIKLMLESPGRRDVGLSVGVMDSDETIRTLALTAALEGCPGHALTIVQRIVHDSSCTGETRALAIRVLARSGEPSVVATLVRLALVRKFPFLRRRIAAKSPEVVAAVAGLASHWSTDPRAAEVLSQARHHRDFEIRSSAATAPE